MKNEIVHKGIIGIFVALYALVATISMVNSVAFFDLAYNDVMSWVLAFGFELGAAASLAAIIILDRTNKKLVWAMFLLLTGFQMMANGYHAYVNLEDFKGWIELFGLTGEDVIVQKRILSGVSGAILPLVSLGFIKSLVDYIRPDVEQAANSTLAPNLKMVPEDDADEELEEKILEEVQDYTSTKQNVPKQTAQKPTTQMYSQQPSQTEKKRITPLQGQGQLTLEKNVKVAPAQNVSVPAYKP